MIRLSSQDRRSIIRLASSLPKGDETRRAILSGLKDAEAEHSGARTSARRSVEDDDSGEAPSMGVSRKGDPEKTQNMLDEYKDLKRIMPTFMKEFERRFYNRGHTWTEALRAIKFEGLSQADFAEMERSMNPTDVFDSIMSKAFKKTNNSYRNILLKPSNFDKVWDFSKI